MLRHAADGARPIKRRQSSSISIWGPPMMDPMSPTSPREAVAQAALRAVTNGKSMSVCATRVT